MITKNFRLNALANQYSAALYNHITATSGGDYFMIDAGGESVRVNILGGVKGMRDLVDGYALEAIKEHYQAAQWEAAKLAAGVLGIDSRAEEQDEAKASQRRKQLEAESQRREQERQKKAVEEAEQRQSVFVGHYQRLTTESVPGESQYLAGKGLTGFTFPVLPDGSLLLALVDESGAVTAAQTITPMGEKRLLTGSAKRGAYHAINAPESPQSVLIAEGLATALSVHLMRPDALTVAAIDAGNLLPVAEVMRRKLPDAEIIIAADNDHHEDGQPNTGREAAEKAALSVAGSVSLPPTKIKADWNDYQQQNGLEASKAAFTDSMYQPQGEYVKPPLQAIKGGKTDQPQKDPLKPHVESRKDGVYWITPKVDKESGEIINNESWLASPMEVIGTGRDDKDQYLILRWLAFGAGIPTTAAIPLASHGGDYVPYLMRG